VKLGITIFIFIDNRSSTMLSVNMSVLLQSSDYFDYSPCSNLWLLLKYTASTLRNCHMAATSSTY